MAIGCVPCSCHEVGSVSTICDPVSGLCDCKPGVFGAGCDTCLDGYYDFSDVGCKCKNIDKILIHSSRVILGSGDSVVVRMIASLRHL